MNPHILVIDAIDGAGKDTLASLLLEALAKSGRLVFDGIAYQKKHGHLPTLDNPDVRKAEILLICEPTYVKHRGASYRLRDHIVPGSTTTQRELVRMYAEDREALYQELALPFLEKGGKILQVRGLSSSLAYQRAVDPSITIEEILREPGNQLELKHAPHALVLLSLPQKVAAARRAARGEKDDPSMFDAEDIQDRTRENYHSSELREIFTSRGTKIIDLDATGTREENFERLMTALAPYLE